MGTDGVRAQGTAIDTDRLRASEFPWVAETTYLNHASTGPLPERTRIALDVFNRRRTRPFELSDEDQFAVLSESRRLISRLLRVSVEEIALTVNTGFGLSLAARALPLQRGDIVLVSDREFPANVYPWMRLRDIGVTMELVPTTSEGWPDEPRLLERLTDPRVRVLAISLVQFSNGYLIDLASLSEATRRTGAYLVLDAIQAVGQLPVDLSKIEVDLLACGGQKWLLSPWGSGFVYVRRELISKLSPPITGWMAFEGTDDFSRLTRYHDSFRPDARRFELITLPYQDFAGMNASLDLLLDLGIDRIAAHLRGLQAPLVDWAVRSGVPIASPRGRAGTGILCLAPERVDEVYRSLSSARIVCSLREGAIRLSPHAYNTLAEMERVVDVLDSAISSLPSTPPSRLSPEI
jgi:cysteine desulfurase / selenocysteine lyase